MRTKKGRGGGLRKLIVVGQIEDDLRRKLDPKDRSWRVRIADGGWHYFWKANWQAFKFGAGWVAARFADGKYVDHASAVNTSSLGPILPSEGIRSASGSICRQSESGDTPPGRQKPEKALTFEDADGRLSDFQSPCPMGPLYACLLLRLVHSFLPPRNYRIMDYKKYEKLVAELYYAVKTAEDLTTNLKTLRFERNKKIRNSYGVDREFDIYWEYQLDGVVHNAAIECKNYNSTIPIEKMDGSGWKVGGCEKGHHANICY